MRICIPTESDAGKNAKVCEHFGSAVYFTIYDSETGSLGVIDNRGQHHAHGTCEPMGALDGKDVDVVVCGGIGGRALKKLTDKGISVFGASGNTVAEVIEQYAEKRLKEITAEEACSGHDCR